MNDPLQYTFEDARRQQLLDGIALSTSAKVAWFEEMVALALAVRFGVRDRLKTWPGFGLHEKTGKSNRGIGGDEKSTLTPVSHCGTRRKGWGICRRRRGIARMCSRR